MALNSWQSCSASASSTRRLSSSERISPVSCRRSFSASGWALSEAWASNLSLRVEMLEESSLSKACAGYDRGVVRIPSTVYIYRGRSLTQMHDYVQSTKSLIQHDKTLDVPTHLMKNESVSTCFLPPAGHTFLSTGLTQILLRSPLTWKPLTAYLKKTQELFLELWNYIQITYILNVITLNSKFKFWQILLYIYCLFVFGGSTVDLRYLKTFTGALGLVDVVWPLAQSLRQVLPLLGDGAQLSLHFYQVLGILRRVPSLGENSLCRLCQLVKLWSSGLKLAQHKLEERREGTAHKSVPRKWCIWQRNLTESSLPKGFNEFIN